MVQRSGAAARPHRMFLLLTLGLLLALAPAAAAQDAAQTGTVTGRVWMRAPPSPGTNRPKRVEFGCALTFQCANRSVSRSAVSGSRAQ